MEPGSALDSFIDPAAEAHDKDTDIRAEKASAIQCRRAAAAASALALASTSSKLDYQHDKGISLER